MSSTSQRPDVPYILRGLKDFQKKSVDYIFRRMYQDSDLTKRFLVADEVGLGKTLIARGMIAKAVDHLWDKIKRIDILYICSNSDIARQNINKLKINQDKDFSHSSRITLLPLDLHEISENKLNFVSFTPGTSFDLKQSLGLQRERALLYRMLEETWQLSGTGALNLLQGNTRSKDRFRDLARSEEFAIENIDKGLLERFGKAVREITALRARFDDLCEKFGRAREHIPQEQAEDRNRIVGELRSILANTCIHALEPDLVILDEFQRFKYLLDGSDPASELAQQLFNYTDVRVLLLSATPYKMYTQTQDCDGEDHYQDFIQTLRFLQNDQRTTDEFEKLISSYRKEVFRLRSGNSYRIGELKQDIESQLRKVMVRTERLAVSEDRNGMLIQVPMVSSQLKSTDLSAYLTYQAVAREVEADDTLEYWKSAPYLLNFMEEYNLKKAFNEAVDDPKRSSMLGQVLTEHPDGMLSWADVERYKAIDPANAKLRSLITRTIENGAYQLLWIPPSLPYYRPEGAFAQSGVEGFTKNLIFSAWKVVPQTIAPLLSYEAERRIVQPLQPNARNTPEARKARKALLRFARTDGRLTGLPVLGLMYPCATLAQSCDPLTLNKGSTPSQLPTLRETLDRAQSVIHTLLSTVKVSPGSDQIDENWYWAAPILLDLTHQGESIRAWFAREDLDTEWSGEQAKDEEEQTTAWADHLERVRDLLAGKQPLGRQPADLEQVLAQMAIGGLGVTALRSLHRLCGSTQSRADPKLMIQGARIAWTMRNLFNTYEVMALVRGATEEDAYWRRVLEYCTEGVLQSTLDEYVHVLKDQLGMHEGGATSSTDDIIGEMCEALALRTVTLGVDQIEVATDKQITSQSRRMRARYALRFGTYKADEGDGETRQDLVRKAFNSPFWPFVLITTSIGQEGLDFHPYCHAIVHWNLPSNPVDLEQREGRIHRYKCHAVRKNIAKRYGELALGVGEGDPWELMFKQAKEDQPQGTPEIVPYWVYSLPDGCKIERHVPALPLSKDVDRLEALRRSLAIYRMIFGQPRQEDLLDFLLTQFTEEEALAINKELTIDLSPR